MAVSVRWRSPSTIERGRGRALAPLAAGSGLSGCAVQDRRRRAARRRRALCGRCAERPHARARADGALRRHAESFFQANRFLVPDLVHAVMDAVAADGPCSTCTPAWGCSRSRWRRPAGARVMAVEGDRVSGADLQRNARAVRGRSRPDGHARQRRGLSRGSVAASRRHGHRRSAADGHLGRSDDVGRDDAARGSSTSPAIRRRWRATRDGCSTADMRLESLRAFDSFPNTPHIEALGVFVR